MFVNTNTVIIYWKQWAGKTLFWTILAGDFLKRYYWNVEIINKVNWEKIWINFSDIWFLKTIKFSKMPWLVLFDEMGLNFNSKEHWTDKNKILSQFFFLVRKFNLSSVFISQRFNSVPVDMRELCDLIFKVEIVPRKKKKPLFKITREELLNDWTLEFIEEYVVDLLWIKESLWIEYNTLESSLIT